MQVHPSIAALVALCGAPAFAGGTPMELGAERLGTAGVRGHIYLNAATGETLVSRDPVAARGDREPAWAADNTTPCATLGDNSGFLTALDDPDLNPSHPLYDHRLGSIYLDWGDVPFDTLIDAVGLTYSTRIADSDTDGDGFPDGVEGFGATWRWFDADNGGNPCNGRWHLTSLTLSDLPGDDQPQDWVFATYFLTVDLADDPANTFEVGDSDGDGQGAVHFNHMVADDLDDDGLHDFAHAVQFHQPGTIDFDGDGAPDGDPGLVEHAGVLLVAPSGTPAPHPTRPGEWVMDPADPLPSAQGLEDAYVVLTSDGGHLGSFWHGGFSCDQDGDGVPGESGDFRPFASFYHVLYSPSKTPPCPPDVYPPGGDDALNFFDVSAFIALFNALDPVADVFPAGGDGQFNFFDVSAYMNAFNAGCP